MEKQPLVTGHWLATSRYQFDGQCVFGTTSEREQLVSLVLKCFFSQWKLSLALQLKTKW